MAFPWISEEGFELGTRGDFDAEVDTNTKLDFPHYTSLAGQDISASPWKGAYCMRVDLSKGTAAAYVQETGDWDMTNGTNDLYMRFMLWVDPNLTMATTNEFAIMQYWASTSTVEAGVYINYTTANGYRIGIGKNADAASSFLDLPLGQWVSVETFFDPAAGTGTFDLWLDGGPATQIASITNTGNITSGIVGTTGIDAGTTKGIILFDDIITDDARIYPPADRWKETVLMTESGHAFVGPGTINNITLLSGAGTDNIAIVFDTDEADTNDASNTVVELQNTATTETVDPAGMPVNVKRGCYVSLAGTNPRARVMIKHAVAYGSDGAVRSYALRRS